MVDAVPAGAVSVEFPLAGGVQRMVSPGNVIAGSVIVDDEAQRLLRMLPTAPETCPVVRP